MIRSSESTTEHIPADCQAARRWGDTSIARIESSPKAQPGHLERQATSGPANSGESWRACARKDRRVNGGCNGHQKAWPWFDLPPSRGELGSEQWASTTATGSLPHLRARRDGGDIRTSTECVRSCCERGVRRRDAPGVSGDHMYVWYRRVNYYGRIMWCETVHPHPPHNHSNPKTTHTFPTQHPPPLPVTASTAVTRTACGNTRTCLCRGLMVRIERLSRHTGGLRTPAPAGGRGSWKRTLNIRETRKWWEGHRRVMIATVAAVEAPHLQWCRCWGMVVAAAVAAGLSLNRGIVSAHGTFWQGR